ncbi:MAG: hypothetical protein ACREBV_06035, partial [Candidatus Zixiibacteriota bacterium]
SSGTAADKIAALEKVGVPVASSPTEIPKFVKQMLRGGNVKRSVISVKTEIPVIKKQKVKPAQPKRSFTIRKAAKGPFR